MRIVILISLILLVLISSCDTNAQMKVWTPPPTPDDVPLRSAEMAKRGVVKIASSWGNGKVEVGAGIMLDYQETNLFVMTAHHVVRDPDIGTADTIRISFYGEILGSYPAHVLRYDDKKDLAVIVIKGFYEKKHLDKIVKIPIDLQYNYNGYGKIKTLGHPRDQDWQLVIGDQLQTNDILYMGISRNAIDYGNSGGPVLSENNRMIGMVIEVEGEQIGYALKIRYVIEALEKWGIPYRTRFVGDIKSSIEKIRSAVWSYNWDALKGRKIVTPLAGVNLWYSTVSAVEHGNARVFQWIDEDAITLVEYLGSYGSDATLDEAWRIWVRELASALGEGYNVEEKGKYGILFWKYQAFAWPETLKVIFEVMEQRGDLFLLVYNYETDVPRLGSVMDIKKIFDYEGDAI